MGRDRFPRRPKATLTNLGALGCHLRNPWTTAWWSAAIPGLGHLFVSNHFTGLLLIVWEFVVNTQARINAAIVLSFTGQFQAAREVVDPRWLLMYTAVYVYAIWDSYAETVEQNKFYIIAEREDYPISPVRITALEFGFAKKRKPLLALVWSLLTPGLGHLYVRKLEDAVVLLALTILTAYMSHFSEAVQYSFVGDFARARAVVDYEWLLFMPSLYGYGAYGAYAAVVEVNKFYDAEQARYLRQEYMSRDFTLPL